MMTMIYKLMEDRKIKELLDYINTNDIRGISFLTIIDLLKQHNVDLGKLREKGAVVEYAQIFDDAKKYQANIEKNPASDLKFIQRLQKGLSIAKDEWRKGKLNNAGLEDLLNRTSLSILSDGEVSGYEDIGLQKYFNQKVKENMLSIYQSWLNGKLGKNNEEEIDRVVSDSLWVDWFADNSNYSSEGRSQMRENQVNILLEKYKNGVLSNDTKNLLEEKLIKTLIDQAMGEHLKEHPQLNEKLLQMVRLLTMGKHIFDPFKPYNDAIKELLQQYSSGPLDKEVKKSLEGYIKDILFGMVKGEEKLLIDKDSVQMLLKQFKQKNCNQQLQDELGRKIENIVMDFLKSRYSNGGEFKARIKREVIEEMLKNWKKNELPEGVLEALNVLLLREEDKLIRSINETISPAIGATKIKKLEEKVTALTDLVYHLMSRLEVLESKRENIVENGYGANVAQTNSSSLTTERYFGETRHRIFDAPMFTNSSLPKEVSTTNEANNDEMEEKGNLMKKNG